MTPLQARLLFYARGSVRFRSSMERDQYNAQYANFSLSG